MSALAAHAQAARIMAAAFRRQADRRVGENFDTLDGIADAYAEAADAMEQAIRDEIAVHPSGCTVDHRSIKTPKCAACGAARG